MNEDDLRAAMIAEGEALALLAAQEKFECPNCKGMGEVRGPERGMPYYLCQFCEGEGAVSADKADDWHFADWPGA